MMPHTLVICMEQLEGKYRAIGRYWDTPIARTLKQQIEVWDDDDGARAVRRFVYEEESGDPARLHGIYCDIRARRVASPTSGGERLPPGRALELMVEGWRTGWAREHPGEAGEVPDDWMRLFRRLAARRAEAIAADGTVASRPNIRIDVPPSGFERFARDDDPFAEEVAA